MDSVQLMDRLSRNPHSDCARGALTMCRRANGPDTNELTSALPHGVVAQTHVPAPLTLDRAVAAASLRSGRSRYGTYMARVPSRSGAGWLMTS